MMPRFAVILLGLTIHSTAVWAADNGAFSAIETVREEIDTGTLAEMTGKHGEPQPQSWKLVFNDPAARGGVREVEVSRGSVVSQRTPLRGYAGVGAQPVLIQSRLNVDSQKAFQIANQQAKALLLGFDWVNYTLRPDNVTAAPLWRLQLYDHMGVRVGTIQISAQDGTIVMPLKIAQRPPYETEQSDGMEDLPGSKQIGGLIGTVGDIATRTALTVKDATLRTVGTVEEIVTGERTIGPKDDDE